MNGYTILLLCMKVAPIVYAIEWFVNSLDRGIKHGLS